MVKKQIDKRENKLRRLATELAKLSPGEFRSLTNVCKSINIHHDTGEDIADGHDSLNEIGFITMRDKKDRVRGFMGTDESLDTRKQIRDIKISLINLEKDLDEIKTEIKKRK